MSAIRKSILPAALMLVFVVGSALPAAARPGIWAYLRTGGGGLWISLINMTSYRLVITENSFDIGCYGLERDCHIAQSYPFQGSGVVGPYGTLYLEPYRTATWLSQSVGGTDTSNDGYWRWNGHFRVQPEPSDWAVPDTQTPPVMQSGVTVRMHPEDAGCPILCGNNGRGTWIYLDDFTLDDFTPGNWSDAFNAFSPQGIWVAPDFLSDYAHMENAMTLSSNDFVVSLYSVNLFSMCDKVGGGKESCVDNKHVTLVFRENSWGSTPNTTTDVYKGWSLRFVDNNSDSVP